MPLNELLINAKTGIYAILGDPISHSISPVIMNSSFRRHNVDSVFLAFKCGPGDVDCIMRASKLVGLKGYVFTMPIKELVRGYLNELVGEAAVTGAVNCALDENGYLTGYNTDSLGFWTATQEKNTSQKPIERMFVLGMGGFAKAAVTQAALRGVSEIAVVNRMDETDFVRGFEVFLDKLRKEAPGTTVRLLPWKPEAWRDQLADADVAVNATPNGMDGEGDLHELFPYDCVKPGVIFFDAVYNPPKTQFLQIAESRGHPTVDGLDLLAHQGACSFKIWTGISVDPKQMKQDALDFLARNQPKAINME